MADDAVIHLRVPAAQKASWIRESRSAGMRLTDWIIERVERSMQPSTATAIIPDDVQFADLKLTRTSSGSVSFDWSPIERICAASGIDPATLRDGHEDNVAGLIIAWYERHIARGGEPDPAYEDLVAEAQAEDAAGQPYSHSPGRG